MMTLNEYIISIAEHNLITYVEDFKEEEEAKYYDSEDYEVHLHYLIETWKNSIDKDFYNFTIDYTYQGTFEELYNYFIEAHFPEFNNEWVEDIFVRQILVTNVCLK